MDRYRAYYAGLGLDDDRHLVLHARVAFWFLASSILLTSIAQLLFRFVMQDFAAQGHDFPTLIASISTGINPSQLWLLAAGIVLYGLSMLCWILALVRFAVSQAYPAMAIGYVIVYFAAIVLPGLSESISLSSLLGVALIVAGVVLVAQES